MSSCSRLFTRDMAATRVFGLANRHAIITGAGGGMVMSQNFSQKKVWHVFVRVYSWRKLF